MTDTLTDAEVAAMIRETGYVYISHYPSPSEVLSCNPIGAALARAAYAKGRASVDLDAVKREAASKAWDMAITLHMHRDDYLDRNYPAPKPTAPMLGKDGLSTVTDADGRFTVRIDDTLWPDPLHPAERCVITVMSGGYTTRIDVTEEVLRMRKAKTPAPPPECRLSDGTVVTYDGKLFNRTPSPMGHVPMWRGAWMNMVLDTDTGADFDALKRFAGEVGGREG